MKVQAFVPDWPGPKQHALQNADALLPYCPVTILNDPNDYFNAQWEKARQQFTGDILLWCMADVTLPVNVDDMYHEMIRLFSRGDIGWVAPNVSWTSYIYNQADLNQVEPGIYEVPNTDSLCFAVRADVVRAMPFIDPKICYMWGMDFTASATAKLLGLKVVRDSRFVAWHPNSTGYDIPRASKEMGDLFSGFSPELQKAIGELIALDTVLKGNAR